MLKLLKKENIELMSLCIDDAKLEKCKTSWTKTENLKNYIKLNIKPVCNIRYIKTKIKTFGDRV